MADYHIYIHDVSGGGNGLSTKTMPFSSSTREQSGDNPIKIFTDTTKDVMNMAQNPIGNMISQGISTLSKVAPEIAIALAIAKVVDKVATTAIESTVYVANNCGNFRYGMEYNNVKTIVGAAMNPISYAKTLIDRQVAIDKANAQVRQTNNLTGNSILGNTIRGV